MVSLYDLIEGRILGRELGNKVGGGCKEDCRMIGLIDEVKCPQNLFKRDERENFTNGG